MSQEALVDREYEKHLILQKRRFMVIFLNKWVMALMGLWLYIHRLAFVWKSAFDVIQKIPSNKNVQEVVKLKLKPQFNNNNNNNNFKKFIKHKIISPIPKINYFIFILNFL